MEKNDGWRVSCGGAQTVELMEASGVILVINFNDYIFKFDAVESQTFQI